MEYIWSKLPVIKTAFGGLKFLIAIALFTSVVLTLVTYGYAQTGGDYRLEWSTIDGGGGASSGGVFTLYGTAGQPDAGDPMSDAGGTYTLQGGFWGIQRAGAQPEWQLFLPVVID